MDDRFEALKASVEKGAQDLSGTTGAALDTPVIEGIGGSLLYLTDLNSGNPFAQEYELIEGADLNTVGFRSDLHRPPDAQCV